MSAEGDLKVRALLVDDHAEARAALAERLGRHHGLELIAVASSLREAQEVLPESDPDIVLIDIHGHSGGGVEGCRLLRSLTDAPVVVFTSYMTYDLWTAAREAGAADYLLKDIDTERLSRRIIRLAEAHWEERTAQKLSNDRKDWG